MSGTLNSSVPIICMTPLVRSGANKDPRKAAANAVKIIGMLARLVTDCLWITFSNEFDIFDLSIIDGWL